MPRSEAAFRPISDINEGMNKMNRTFSQTISLILCLVFLSACGQNNLSDGTSTAESTATAETPADPDDQEQGKEKTESEPKSDSIEKYKDIKDVLLALENEEYEKAIDLIKAMKTEQSEPDTEVVKINLENWTEYFSIEVRPTYRYDAMKNIDEVSENWYLRVN